MRKLLAIISFIFLAYSCAQFAQPTGGDKDEDPPVIVKEKSDANFQTNFSASSFQLTFDEWITVNNPVKEVVVSPPTIYPLQVAGRGKTVTVNFSEDEQLKEDVTYQVNFGDAIKDFTEGNIYKNLVFVFSTGDEIDSLSVSGIITDALTDKPIEDIIVCLYDDLQDSAFVKQKPFYFTKTDKSGRYKLSNIRPDTFQLFALKDDNVNYYYDLVPEEVGFFDSLIVLDTANLINLDFSIFNEDDPSRIISYKQDKKGLIKIVFQPKPFDLEIRALDNSRTSIFEEYVKDTLYLWHDELSSDSSRFLVLYDQSTDTLINKKTKSSMTEQKLVLEKGGSSKPSFHRDDTLSINLNKPLKSYNINNIVLQDSTQSYPLKHISIEGRAVQMGFDSIKHKSSYNLTLLPNALTDIYNTSNADTIVLTVTTYDPEKYGSIRLNVVNEQDTQYLLKFISGNNTLGEKTIANTQELIFNNLAKGNYKLQLIQDLNKDGRWTSGNVIQKIPPETIKEVVLKELSSGWDLELDIIIKDIFNGTEVQ